jgi:hypothetical protein
LLHIPLRQSISVRLSALISALLIVAIASFSIIAHLQLKRVLLAAAAARATSATHVLGGFMEDSERRLRMEGEKLAADPAVRRFAGFPTAANRRAAQKSLTTLAIPGAMTIGVELRDKKLQRTLWIDGESSDSAAFIRNGPERPISSSGMAIGSLKQDKGNIFYDLVAPIVGSASAADTAGYVVVYKRLSSASRAQLVGRLIGSDASILMGNTDGKVWTDLSNVVRGPTPNRALKNVLIYNGPDGSPQIGAATRIGSTPWVVWIGIPFDVAMAPANDFLRDMIVVAILLALVGTLGALAISRRIAQPLGELALAGRLIEAGDARADGGTVLVKKPFTATQFATEIRDVLDQPRRAGVK